MAVTPNVGVTGRTEPAVTSTNGEKAMKAAHRRHTGCFVLLLLLAPVLGTGTAQEDRDRTVVAVTAPQDRAATAVRQAAAPTDSDTPWGP
ncbi:hypothetical protein GCM10010247_15300 [Streptomyces calvus]|jgi:hypothetical protein|nr:hypothetical protein GCM10010247_15300 [Streptomyces calvus]